MHRYLSKSHVRRDLAIRDLTDPAGGAHAIQILIDRAVGALQAKWHCEVRFCRGDRIVTVEENYDCLGFHRSDVTRDARYTRYLDARHMFRSHSSAMVPSALRHLAASPVPDVLVVCPGIVFRRDAIDRLHTGAPHQLDLWRISRSSMIDSDMDEMIRTLATTLVPGAAYRAEPRVHPYTTGGRQVDIESESGWVEVWECGLAHRDVLARAGLDPSWSGLALGMGLDRLLMLVKQIPDIRALRSGDPRIASQMNDLEPYRTVSAMPAVARDLSIAVDSDDRVEDLGDRVRSSLGADAVSVEEVTVLSETSCSDLPPRAVKRLGRARDQKNVLVRILLRDLERTLTDVEANEMRDRIYLALHRGTVFELASSSQRRRLQARASRDVDLPTKNRR